MKPKINGTEFGSVTIEESRHEHDVVLRLSGKVKTRKKRLSNAVYGTSHIISLAEAKDVFEKGASCLILGTGQHGMVKLSDEATEYLQRKGCAARLIMRPKVRESG